VFFDDHRFTYTEECSVIKELLSKWQVVAGLVLFFIILVLSLTGLCCFCR
jgi:hypothetical protein